MAVETYDVGIVGAAVAGSRLAGELAKQSVRAVMVEPNPGWEKPCGGWLPVHTLEEDPLIEQLAIPHRCPSRYVIKSPRGTKVMEDPGYWIVSRRDLDLALFDWALAAGAEHIQDRVVDVTWDDSFLLRLKSGASLRTKTLVGADGCLSKVRRCVGQRPLGKTRMMLTLGAFVPDPQDTMMVQLEDKLPGYLWYLPRLSHASVGICAPAAYRRLLKPRLLQFFEDNDLKEPKQLWGAPFPMITDPDFYRQGLAGDNWILVGDAAAAVNAVTGGGILFALLSALLASQAILQNRPALYQDLVNQHSQELCQAATAMDTALQSARPDLGYRYSALDMLFPQMGRFDLL